MRTLQVMRIPWSAQQAGFVPAQAAYAPAQTTTTFDMSSMMNMMIMLMFMVMMMKVMGQATQGLGT